MTLSSSELIQINATIMAGLFILLAVESITGTANLQTRYDDTTLELETINTTLEKLCGSYYERNGAFYFNAIETEKCDDLLWQKNHLVSELETIRTAFENPKKIGLIVDPISLSIVETTFFTMVYLALTPFAFSASAETILSMKKKELGTPASKLGLITMIIGFIFLIIFFLMAVIAGFYNLGLFWYGT